MTIFSWIFATIIFCALFFLAIAPVILAVPKEERDTDFDDIEQLP